MTLRVRRTPAAAAAIVLAVTLGGCGSASEPAPPAGVDGLVIPTPSLDPADFVARIDNPWLPMAPGRRWTYRSTAAQGPTTVAVEVLEETEDVQGVAATVVHEVARDRRERLVEETHAWFAQDEDGNVWQVGEDTISYDGRRASDRTSWRAGEDGAQAGLAMPARPRLGDGYRMEYLRGEAEDRARVLDVSAPASVPAGDFTDCLLVERTSPLGADAVVHTWYAPDVGLVRAEAVSGGDEVLELLTAER